MSSIFVTNPRGFSLVETITGMLVSTVVMGAIAATMFQLSQTQNASQMQSLVNQQYFLGMQVANNPALFAERGVKTNALGITAAQRTQLDQCLGAIGTDCASLVSPPTAVPSSVDNLLNASFNFNGPCDPTAADCLVTRTVEYQWDCPAANYCSGLRLDLKVAVIKSNMVASDRSIKPRAGTVKLPARQFRSKGEVNFTCPARAVPESLFGVDYTRMTDAASCGGYDSQTTCAMPMTSYGLPTSCRNTQTTDCADGYETVGWFDRQQSCIPAAMVTNTTITQPPPPPPPPPPPSNPQLWTWQGIVYQSTCPFLCDGVEWASCAGPACAAPKIQCYSASWRNVPSHPIGSTTTSQPSGYNCFLRGANDGWIIL